MREILFRGKRKDNGEWVYGYYCKYGFTGQEKHYIIPEYASALYAFEVIPETVEQYTGLTDKNGTKIFEGDIIKDLGGSMDGIPRVVMWNEVWMEFETYLVKRHWAYGINNSRLWCMRDREIEVIGNIHDNPEFLKERNNG